MDNTIRIFNDFCFSNRVGGLRESAPPSDVWVFSATGEFLRTEAPTFFDEDIRLQKWLRLKGSMGVEDVS